MALSSMFNAAAMGLTSCAAAHIVLSATGFDWLVHFGHLLQGTDWAFLQAPGHTVASWFGVETGKALAHNCGTGGSCGVDAIFNNLQAGNTGASGGLPDFDFGPAVS